MRPPLGGSGSQFTEGSDLAFTFRPPAVDAFPLIPFCFSSFLCVFFFQLRNSVYSTVTSHPFPYIIWIYAPFPPLAFFVRAFAVVTGFFLLVFLSSPLCCWLNRVASPLCSLRLRGDHEERASEL